MGNAIAQPFDQIQESRHAGVGRDWSVFRVRRGYWSHATSPWEEPETGTRGTVMWSRLPIHNTAIYV